jgi:hypothetical integral membrane protein (TIGR02206 family)
MSDFHSFSITHLLMIVMFAAFTALIIRLGRIWKDTPRARALDATLALIAIVFWVIDHGRWMLPGSFDPAVALPIHICNLAGLCVPIVLLTRIRIFRALLYFWGIGLSTQSIITPDLVIGPATFGFWMYWINHTIVIGVPIYDVVARGYRPTWRDYGYVTLIGLAYLAIVIPLDIRLHANYGYVGNAMSKQASIVDYLGSWPLRIVWILLLGQLAMALLMLPFEVFSRLEDPTSPFSPRGHAGFSRSTPRGRRG